MVGVVAQNLLRDAKDDLEHLLFAISDRIECVQIRLGRMTTIADNDQREAAQGFQFGVIQRCRVAQRFVQGGVNVHHTCKRGMSGDTVGALMLDIDSLPDDGLLFRVEAGFLEGLVNRTIGLEQLGRTRHHLIEARCKSQGFFGLCQEVFCAFRCSLNGVSCQSGHWGVLHLGVVGEVQDQATFFWPPNHFVVSRTSNSKEIVLTTKTIA